MVNENQIPNEDFPRLLCVTHGSSGWSVYCRFIETKKKKKSF